nr:hypothetical protein [Tanacetum cinerariifolium]
MQTQTSNAFHNAIMEAGGKDRPPMLAPGNYVQWKSRIKRYIDTKPDHGLIHYCLQNPPYKYKWADKDVSVTEAEAVQIILTRIDNDVYFTVDACPNACEMWKAIERLKQGKSINVQDLKTNLYWEFGKFTSRDVLTSTTTRMAKDNSPRINRSTGYDNQRIVNVDRARENVEQADWKDDTDDAPDDQELEAHYMYMAKLQEVTPDATDNSGPIFDTEPLQKVPNNDNYNVFAIESEHPEKSKSVNDTYPIEQDEHNVIIDSLDMSYDREHVDQDDDNDLSNERDLLASLIEKLKCKIDDSKNRNNFLETSNKALVDKLKGKIEDFKTKNKSLESSNNHFKEANNELSKTNQLMYKDLKKFQAELDRYNDVKYASKRYFSERSKMSHTPVNNENSKEPFDKQTTLLEKQMDESIPWDQKCKSTKELFKIKKSVDTIIDGVKRCKQTIAKRTYFDHIDPFIQNTIEEIFCLEIRRINPDLQKFHLFLKEEMVADLRYFNSLELEVDSLRSQLETQKTQFLNEIDRFLREYYYVDHMNAILGVYTELDEVTNLQYSHEKKDCSKLKSVTKINVSNDFPKPVTAQILPPNKKSILKNTNVIAPGMYKLHTKPIQTRTTQLPHDIRKTNKRVSFSTGVIPITSVSRPRHKCNQLDDRVMLNNSQGKKQKVKDHRRNVKFSKNKKSVTACNDNLNAKTSNVNFVCVTCGKCVLNDNHDKCVLHYLNGVNSRTKMPMAVPISTRKPKRTGNQSVAKPLRRTVASESTNQKPRHTTRKLYEHVSKACSWWYPKFTPPGYKWKPKSQIGNINPKLVKIILFIVDSWCSKQMTGNLKLLTNFMEKFLGTVKFKNDQIAPILSYRDLVQGTVTIKRVYYVEGLNHNLFSVGQFCDADLEVAFWKSTFYIRDLKGNDLLTEVAFRKSTCFIRDLKGNDLLTGSRGTDLYSITLQELNSPNLICLMAKATSSQAWSWHRRLSHLNFDTINLLSKNDIVAGLPKLKFVKDHLCSFCELGKAKRKYFHTKLTPSSKRRLHLLHMGLCGPVRVASINGKRYVLVIVDDYSKYTWTHFLRSKDE